MIEIQSPPHFDFGNGDCHRHGGTKASYLSNGTKSEHKVIYDCACWGILSAFFSCDDYVIAPPYYWNALQPLDVWCNSSCLWIYLLFSRFSPEFDSDGCGEKYKASYSEYVERYKFIHYWFDLCFELEKEVLQKYISEIQKKIENNTPLLAWEEDSLEEDLEKLAALEEHKKNAIALIDKNFQDVVSLLLDLYNRCASLHRHPHTYYERGKIFFDQGMIAEFISDIRLLTEKQSYYESIKFEIGKAYNEANQYDLAIRTLSEVIKKDPKNREAYIERAYSYFETNRFDLALKDYLKANIHPTAIDNRLPNFSSYLDFQAGVLSGALQGTKDASFHFVPSLLSTVRGIGVGLWSFTLNPLGISKEIVDSCNILFTYLHENISKETLQRLIPELKHCLEHWQTLKDNERGYFIGRTISQLGVDSLLCMGSGKAVQFGRALRRANAMWTLEQASLSSVRKKEMQQAAQRFFKEREAFKKQCKLHVGQQEKHIPGANNFQKGKSELTISIQRLEDLASKKLGTGIPTRSTFGEPRYRELIDFEETIGIHFTDPKHLGPQIQTPTSIGEIHYDINGGYHIVPVSPNRFLKNK